MTKKPVHLAFLASWLALLPLSGCDQFMSADARLNRANTALEEGNLNKALADARAVAEKDKGRADAWLLLSRVSLKYGDFESALRDMGRAEAAGADPAAVLAVRDDALLLAGRYDELLKAGEDNTSSAAHRVAVAAAQAALGRKDEARRTLDAVLAQDPAHVEARLLQIRMLLADDKTPEAKAAIDSLLVQAPDTARAELYKAQLALADGDTAKAIPALTHAQALSARQLRVVDQLSLLGALIDVHLQTGDVAAAAKWQAQLQQRAPQIPLTQLLSARVSLAQGDATAAVATLQKLLAAQPDLAQARLLLGAALMEQGSTGQARENLTRVLADQPDNFGARKLLAQLHLSQGEVQEASRVMAGAPAGSPADPAADWLRSAILSSSGQSAEALKLLEQASRADPGNVPMQLDLANAYMQSGRREDAARVLKSIPPQKTGKIGMKLQVLTQISGQSLADARQTLVRLKAADPKDAQRLTYIAQLQSQMGDLDAAAETFRSGLAVQPALPEAHLGLAGIAMRHFDVAAAEAELKLAVSADPRNESGYLGLAALAAQQGRQDDARRALEKAISAVPSAVQPRIALATLALRNKESERAASLFKQAVELSRGKGATAALVGDAYLGASQPTEALSYYREAAERGQPDAQLKIAAAQFALNQTDEGRRTLESASASNPKWLDPIAMLVSLDTSERQYDRALQRIQRLSKAGAPEAACEELRGGVYLAQGRAEDAERALARSYQLQPRDTAALRLFDARRLAKTPQPDAVLRQWLVRQPDDQRVRAVLAQHLQDSGDVRGAIAEYEIIERAAPAPALLNNLAWAYHVAKDPRALPTAKRAYDAAPGNALIADTYGWVLLQSGRGKEALPILEQAAKALPDNKEVQAHLASAKASGR